MDQLVWVLKMTMPPLGWHFCLCNLPVCKVWDFRP